MLNTEYYKIQNISGLKIGLHWHTRWNVFSHFPFSSESFHSLLLLLLRLSVWMFFAPARCLLIIKTTTRSGKALSIDRKFPQFSTSTLVYYLSLFGNRGSYASIEFGCGGRRVCVRVSYSKCALTILRSSLFSTCVQVLNITLHSTADTNDRGKQDRIESERKKEKRKEMDEARKGQKWS